jgi:UDP-N-acetylglucosamine--N-acetylmuramyl-(pentapeptide) pyrophosphoryl-undecaprenol N-acetylglucosamine transferase
MIVGGGTGGHVYPGVAVAEAWRERVPDAVVTYVGSERGLEARVVPELGLPFVTVPVRRLKNAGFVERARNLVALPGSLWSARAVVKRHAPDVVLGVGGYVSGPVVLAASLSGRPSAVAEQNAIPGLTNRLLSRFVSRVYTAFPQAADRVPRRKVNLVGNPVRRAFRDAARKAPPVGAKRRILVLGGSQGAQALNEMVPPAMAALRQRFGDLEVRHQTGRDRGEAVRQAYAQAGFPAARVDEFIDDMAGALAAADLVVARAGATTLAELTCMGRPAVLVPFPFAADDHQAANAQWMVDGGGALVARQETLDAAKLAAMVGEILSDSGRLAQMGERSRALGRPDAADAIVDDLLALGGGHGR